MGGSTLTELDDTRQTGPAPTKAYFRQALSVLLTVSVVITAISATGWFEQRFSLEMYQVLSFGLFIKLALQRQSVNATRERGSNWPNSKVMLILGACALAALALTLLITRRVGTIHAIYPVIFAVIALAFGGKLVAACDRSVTRVLIDPALRVLSTVGIGVGCFVVGFGFSLLLWKLGIFTSAPYPVQLLGLAIEVFVQMLPFALYAFLLRRSFQLDGDAERIVEND